MADKVPIVRWPDWMPIVQQSDYNYTPTDRRSRTDMEVGSVLRVNFDTDETVYNCSLLCNEVEAQWFELFEHHIMSQGSEWFEAPLQSGQTINWHTVRFKSRPKATLPGPWHTVYTFSLEVEKRIFDMCPAIAEFLLCFAPEIACMVADQMETLTENLPRGLPDFWNYPCINK